jgi:hypothetical protein
MTRLVFFAPLLLLPTDLFGQGETPDAPPPTAVRIQYAAPDGTVSAVRKGNPSAAVGALRVVPGRGQFTIGFAIDDSGEVCGPNGVEHRVQADTITVTVFFNALQVCPGIVTVREYLTTVAGLQKTVYQVRFFLGEMGGPTGKRSSHWLTARVPVF